MESGEPAGGEASMRPGLLSVLVVAALGGRNAGPASSRQASHTKPITGSDGYTGPISPRRRTQSSSKLPERLAKLSGARGPGQPLASAAPRGELRGRAAPTGSRAGRPPAVLAWTAAGAPRAA